MDASGLAALIRRKTRTSTDTYSDADMLVDVNTYMDELAGKIQQWRPSIWNVPALFDLEEDKREYAFPNDVLNNIVSLELKFSASGDYVPADPIKKNPSGFALQESKIVDAYDNENPKYFIRRKAIYILSGAIIDVTDGGKLVYNAFPKNLTSMTGSTDLSVDPSTTEHGFPREFHELWARRVSIGYKDIKGIKLNREDLRYEDDLEAALENFSTANLDLQETADMPSGESLGDNGFDY